MNAPLPPRALPAQHASSPRIVSALAVAAAVGYLLWLRVPGQADAQRHVGTGLYLALDAARVALFLLAARHPVLGAGTRRAVRCLAAVAATAFCGNVVSLALVPMSGAAGTVSAADLFYLAEYPLLLAAFLSIPLARGRMERWKLVFDSGMVLSGAGVALWYFLLRPVADDAGARLDMAMALAYPLADLLVLVGVVTVILRRPADGNRAAIAWLAVGASVAVAADLAHNMTFTRAASGAALWDTALHLATSVAMLVSAEQFWRSPRPPEEPSERGPLGTLVSALPFVAAGATYALLLVIAVRDWVAPLSGLAVGAIAVSFFLGARQVLSLRQAAVVVAQAAIRASEARFRSLVQHSSDLIFVLDAGGIIQFASSSASRLIGYSPESLAGVALTALTHPEDAGRVAAFIEMTADLPGVSPLAEWRLRRPDGHAVQVEAIASNLLADESVRGIVLNARDVGERKALLDQLAHQAFHDPLTGLANRALFRDRVQHAVTLARRQARAVTVLYLDLDDFKAINDTLGHAEGDRLLAMIAARLRACARSTDTVARLGGDEFAILVEDTASPEATERLVERIGEQMRFPFALSNGDVAVTVSIGSASALGGAMDEILRHADVAMYSAKRSGRGLHRAFDAAMLGSAE